MIEGLREPMLKDLDLPIDLDQLVSAQQLIEIQADRGWEMWLSVPEWELIGSLARAGEMIGMVPEHFRGCAGSMYWALGLVRHSTDLVFEGLEVHDDLSIWLLTDEPISVSKEWSNQIYILGTMYTAEGDELKPAPGTPGWYPDPNWEVLVQIAQQVITERTTRCGPTMDMLVKLQKQLVVERKQAHEAARDPQLRKLMRKAIASVDRGH